MSSSSAPSSWVEGKTVMVTGAAGGIGASIAALLAQQGASEIILVCRTEAQCKDSLKYVKKRAGEDKNVSYEVADLSLHSSISSLASRYTDSGKPLHVLIPNHATAPQNRVETAEGLEVQFAANVMGYYWLVKYFAAILSRSSSPENPSRVILVASYYAGGLQIDDMEFKKRRYDNDQAYQQSKQANRMLAFSFAHKFSGIVLSENIQYYNPFDVSRYSCHPGDVNTKLSNSLGFGGSQTGDEGASTPVWLATNHEVGAPQHSGMYFYKKRGNKCGFCEDKTSLQQLWDLCEYTTRRLDK